MRMFYVAISKERPGCGKASCIDEPDKRGQQVIRAFFRENAGHEIRHVDGDEMVRLMTMEPSSSQAERGG